MGNVIMWREKLSVYSNILDEPFAFIDENRKKLLMDRIEAKVYAGKGIILTSHEKQEWIEEKAFIVEFTNTGVKRYNS